MKGVRTTTNRPRSRDDMKNLARAIKGAYVSIKIEVDYHRAIDGETVVQYCAYSNEGTHHYFKTWRELVEYVEKGGE